VNYSRSLKMSLKSFLKGTVLYSRFIVGKRARHARAFLKFANIYPESIDEIISDYAFSIERDYRQIMQVLNLEECVRYVVAEKIPGAFVETGTYTGGASAYGLRALLRNDAAAVRSYWGFDSFEGMPQPTGKDGAKAVQWMFGRKPEDLDSTLMEGRLEGSSINLSDYESTKLYLLRSGYPADQINLVKGWFQNTLPVVRKNIGSIAILRLDGDFYESTKCVLENLYEQVSDGGVVIIDDYGSFEGCRRAVDEYLEARGEKPFIHYVENGVRFFVKKRANAFSSTS
jgi:O-methyltransferase